MVDSAKLNHDHCMILTDNFCIYIGDMWLKLRHMIVIKPNQLLLQKLLGWTIQAINRTILQYKRQAIWQQIPTKWFFLAFVQSQTKF